jgi:hypothetical protein
MARIYPAHPDPGAPASERKVFERLRDGLPGDWVVIHGQRVVRDGRAGVTPFEGELDFLVVIPEWGWIGLEVKGGGVARTGSGWTSVDRDGTAHPISDPGKQVQRAVHAIRKYLVEHPRSRLWADKVPFGWGVVLPDVDVPGDLGPELPRPLVLDRGDLDEIRKSLERVAHARSPAGTSMDPAIRAGFLAALAPQYQLVPSVASRIEEDDVVLVRLTEEQIQILDALADMPRLAVKGVAGTGKTLVAMEKARRLADSGRRVLFLCYNRPLAEFLAERADRFTVKNFHALCRDLATAAGIPFKPPKDPAAAKEYWELEPPQQLIQALEAYPDERFDAVIVDEGQDFSEYWWVAVEKLLRDPKKSTLWVFFDPYQNLYGGGPTEVLGLSSASLTWNCRNTGRIAAYSSDFVGFPPRLKPGTPDGLRVQELSCDGDAVMIEAVRKTLHRLVVEERLSTDRIVVLSPRSLKSSPVWRANRFGNLTLVEHPARPGPHEVVFSPLQRFKGLEADVVILCEVQTSDPACSPAHLYVGTSRARHVLVVLRYGSREGG